MAKAKTETPAAETIIAARQAKRPAIHVLNYADSNLGKSTFASTFPTPILVKSFDPLGKETPYLNLGKPTPIYLDDEDIRTRDVVTKAKGLVCRVQYFIDRNPKDPMEFHRFLNSMVDFQDEIGDWKTLVLDSTTSMELAARKREEYVLNPISKAKDPRQWWGGSTSALEEVLCIQVGSLDLNVVVICHVDRDKDESNGHMVRMPAAPGRLRKDLGSKFPEMYHAYVDVDEKGVKQYLLQTQSDKMWSAGSHINAPDPSWATYESLWSNWDAGRLA